MLAFIYGGIYLKLFTVATPNLSVPESQSVSGRAGQCTGAWDSQRSFPKLRQTL